MRKLDQSINKLIEKHQFEGLLLQLLKVRATTQVPTLGVTLNKMDKFELYINYEFFDKLSDDEKVAILHHEMLHLRHKHVWLRYRINPSDHKLANMAMDISINQLITGLPEKALNYQNFTDVNKKPFEANQPFEVYMRQLKEMRDSKKDTSDEEGTSKGDKLDKNGQPKKSGNGEIRANDGTLWEDSMDSHDWELSEEALKELRNLFKRTLDKQEMTFGHSDKQMEEVIDMMNLELRKLDHRKLVAMAYRKSMPSRLRMSTWKRPNRRWGTEAKGTKSDEAPKIDTYLDTSGSISIKEYNTFLGQNDKFLVYANKSCTLNFFHDNVYLTKKYKTGQKLQQSDIQSGGTNLEEVIAKIDKDKPDLAIIFTDGYFGDVSIKKIHTKILFIISEDGTVEHPLRHLGTTVKLGV